MESRSYKMHVRVLLSRYRSYRTCPDCEGRRFNPTSAIPSPAEKEGVKGPIRYGAGEPSALHLNDALALPPGESPRPAGESGTAAKIPVARRLLRPADSRCL
ncbi:MAG: hypothetical protein KIT22_08040 [Verrucomicrobiae bacterium]|nr:hypothetical protein [Verrucomicrobiae bacterium]